MSRRARDILKRLPRRRPRQWRYVSPHRRSAGMVFLALLTVGLCAYWLLPRLLDDWTRDLASGYLGSFTGGQVRIRQGGFSLFGGIELRGVRIDVPGSRSGEPFFQADTVVLRHRPWGLLSAGRLEPTEIVCIAPTVTLEYDAEKGRYTAEELIAAARRARRPGGGLSGPLPTISIRDVRLRLLDTETRLSISMVPTGRIYRIVLEERSGEGDEPLRGTWRLDLATGRLHLEESRIPALAHTDSILPDRYAKWRRLYNIQGKVVLKGTPATAPARAILDAELDGVSLQLQPAEGGLRLEDVHGTLRFRADGVSTVVDLTGRAPTAGGAAFLMSGSYDGYDANSPFRLRVEIQGMTVPDGRGATGWLADRLAFLNRTFRPSGKMDLHARCTRREDGNVELTGTAWPRSMAFLYRHVPYRLDQVTGAIHFVTDEKAGEVSLADVTGRHGPAELAVQGRIDLWRKDYFDVRVTAKDLPLDANVQAALPEDVRKIWEQFDPAGTAAGTVRVRQDGPDEGPRTDVALAFDGKASMSYQGFPYRIGGLSGQVRIAGSKVAVDSVTGDRGPMHCTVDGTLAGLGGAEGQTDLTIEATDFPLDANLIAALPAGTRKAVASLHPAGRAERVTVRLRQSPGEEADLRVVAHLRDAGFQAEACPYRVDGVSGLLTVRPGRLVLEGIRGRHGQTPVEIDGQVLEGEGSHGLDLRIRATGVDLGAELYAVLPAEVQRIWRKLSPSGPADVELSLRHDMPDDRRKTDYRLVLQGRGMNVRYEDFPYSLREIVGRAVATPEGVELTRVIATHGKAKLIVDGALRFDDDGESASLSVTGQAVPIDEELLAAVPKSLAPLAERFRPGGTCSVDLKELRIARRVLAPGAGPATAPADANEAVAWSVRGQVGFDRATIDIGLGHKTLSGSLRGSAAQSGQGPAVEAEISLDSVEVGPQRLTKLLGRLRKQPHSEVMRLDDLSARAHGGRAAGLAEVRLADPLEFGVSLSVDGIQIADMVNAGVTDPAKRLDVGGLLAGNVQLTVKGGARPQRQASGVLRITHGKILRLPVMLGLLHVVYLALPGETAFTDGTLTYHLRDDTLVFNEIYLRGPALSIVGSGTLDMKTEVLDLKFLSGPPQKLPRLGSLTELLEGIAREVAEIHVTGTLQKPQMRTLPLRNLDRFLRDLMNPGTGR